MDGICYNMGVTIGLTFGPVRFYLQDSAGGPVDLTGWSVWAEVRNSADGPVLIDLAPTIVDAENGEVVISATDEVTGGWDPLSARWDLILEDPEGERTGPYVEGAFIAAKPITQPAN
jgi:hypothetical protein